MVEEQLASGEPQIPLMTSVSPLSAGSEGVDPATDSATAVSKVIRHLLPLLFVACVLAQLDRVNVSMAALTMTADIGLSPATFGLGVSAFLVIYALCEIPSNYGLARFGARRWIARIMFSWGLVSVATALVVGPASFLANRALLAVAEAGFLPGVLAFLSSWLPAKDRARVFSLFLLGVPLANVIGGPIAAGLLRLDGVFGLRGWQWLFLLEGLPPLLLSFAIWTTLRDRPQDAAWLSAAEVAALTGEQQAHDDGARIGIVAAARALLDVRVLVFMLILGCLGGVNQAVAFWLPQIVHGAGLSITETGFAVAAPYLLGAAAMVGWSAHSDRTGERRWHLALPGMAAGVLLAAAAAVPGAAPRLLLLSLSIGCLLALQGVFWSTVSVALEGAQRTIAMGAVSAGGLFFAFLAPFLIGVSKQWTGGFDLAFVILGAFGVVGGGLALVMATWAPPRRLQEGNQ